jgi:hypothetical protein
MNNFAITFALNAHSGIVTFVGFTCQQRVAFKARMSKFQCLRVVIAAPARLENRLFLSNVTMPTELAAWR